MVNYHKSEGKAHLPSISYRPNSPYAWSVDYGPSRGSRGFKSEEEARDDVINFISMRVDTISKDLFELCRMKRRLLK